MFCDCRRPSLNLTDWHWSFYLIVGLLTVGFLIVGFLIAGNLAPGGYRLGSFVVIAFFFAPPIPLFLRPCMLLAASSLLTLLLAFFP